MTTLTDKELIKEIKERIGSLDVRDNIERRAYEIALASLEADPVAYIFKHPAGKLFWALTDESNKDQSDVIPVYAAHPVPVVPAALPENDDEDGHDIDYLEPSEVYSLGRTAGWNACRAAMLHGAEPVSQTYNLPELIEGMEVSIDVSTCDADLGNRYFGTVTEALELDTAKNGYILLFQDAEPNFDVNGNYPVIPSEVLSAILKVAKIRADFDDFDGDRRGIGDCLDEAEQELIVTINKYASQLAAEPIATNDVREQQTAVPPVPEIQDDVAQAIENLKQKLVECNRYNYCADAVKGVEDACHAAMLQGSQPVSQTYKLNELSGNSPVTPDGWISCSDRMPEDTKMLLAFSQGQIVAAYWNWVMSPIDYKKYRAFT